MSRIDSIESGALGASTPLQTRSPRTPGCFRRSGRSALGAAALVACFVVLGPAPAQSGTGSTPAAQPEAKAPTEAPIAAEEGAAAEGMGAVEGSQQAPQLPEISDPASVAVVKAEGMALRCFASDASPKFADPLTVGMPLELLEEAPGYVKVRGPFGPKGWVSKRFTKAGAPGTVLVDGIGVSFRYRPKAGELPVEVLKKDTVLAVVGEQGEWWQVRYPAGTGWLKSGEVDVFRASNPTLIGRWRDAARARAEVAARFAVERSAQAKASAEQAARLEQLGEIRASYRVQLDRPYTEWDFKPVLASLKSLEGASPEADETVRNGIAALRDQIQRQTLVAEAFAIQADNAPVPAVGKRDNPNARSRDGLERFDAIGWLRYRPDARDGEVFALEKGGRILCYLDSPDARYDLRLLEGLELGVIASGPAARAELDSMAVVPVSRVEVLGVPRKR